MGVSSAVFESAGKRTEHYVPGVYSRSNNVTSPAGVSSGNLCIIGESQGGTPDTLLEFGSLAEAKETLINGDLLEAVGYAFNGSSEYIPQKVYAMRVNSATQASLTLKNGSTELLKCTSVEYGTQANQLKLSVDAGTTSGSTKITCVYKDDTITTDDILRKSISILGSDESCNVTISAGSITLSSTDETITLNFDEYQTIGALVARINDTENFVATALDTDSDAASDELDTVTSTSVSGSSAVTFYSNYAAFVEALKAIKYIASVEELSETTRIVPETSESYQYFTGGTSGSVDVTAWTKALEVLETEDVQIIATPSTDSSIHTLIVNHCTTMSTTVNRKERTCILGGDVGETDDTAIAKAVGFNSELCSYVTDSATANNPLTGDTETISGAMVAVMLAGMEAAMSVNVPLTNKTLKVLGFSKKRTITNMENLIKKGILVCNPAPEDMTNYVVIRALTTYQKADLIYNERSMVRENLFMNRDLRAAYAPMIGNANTASQNDILNVLKNKGNEWGKKGYVVASDSNEYVWNTTVSVDGDKIYITFSRYLTAPTNFIFITATNHVYSSTVEL